MSKRIAILGSTGSIGRNTLKVIDALGPEYEVAALSARKNIGLLAEQARRFKPGVIGLADPERAEELKDKLGDFKCEILTGPQSLVEIAQLDEVDIVVAAIVGAAGLPAVLAAAEKGKTLAIANKEPLVIAGQMLTESARDNGATILPIDSEHSAIFQAMRAGSADEVSRIILTASGGPFRSATPEQIEKVTIEDALAHPTWSMGPKITVDSATMMNKALEIIEAVWLFDVSVDKIDVLIHPESIIHSLLEFVDGSVIAQMGTPDMTLPIQFALTYPRRVKGIAEHLKLDELGTLTFEKPNPEVFRALALGFEVARCGGSAPVVFNAANEAAVKEFLDGRIKFAMIVELIEHCLDKHDAKTSLSLDELLEIDAWARRQVETEVSRLRPRATTGQGGQRAEVK